MCMAAYIPSFLFLICAFNPMDHTAYELMQEQFCVIITCMCVWGGRVGVWSSP